MQLILNEEEQMVRESAQSFLADNAGPSLLREIRDSNNSLGYSDKLWQQMIELGWPSLLIPEQFDGLGFSHVAMGQIMEQAGCHLANSPMFATAVLGVSILSKEGNEQQKSQWLPKIAMGNLTLALALDETARPDPLNIATSVTKSSNGFVLNGNKSMVIDGQFADQLIVVTRSSGKPGDSHGISLFLIPRNTPGVEINSTLMMDSRNTANIRFSNVAIGEDQLIGTIDQGMDPLTSALNVANIHLSAELLGIANECLQRTVGYLKDRKQFGVNIGSFQALQHRAASLWSDIELCKSTVIAALRSLDESAADSSLIASIAKVKACKVAQLATNESIQMHGGIGMTDEFDIGFFIKRARIAQMHFGDHRYHLNRYAELSGY
ncbi:MAG: acyl-CoA dehydrogenase [Porticoccaceae bacterium]|jgi:alkylation response protein AidB-like acyl-CoA dehydrogenase|nr:acyl-CoA dehydrogenase [Porticoccaceae bacterium]|tara:strand:- start:3318 stop:4457 length:1140 start_codon:yes stop_codon:yes gene_type:complete